MATKKKSTNKGTSKFLIGAGVTAAVAAGVVGFLTQTKQGQKLAKKGKEHAGDIAKQVAKEAEKMKKITKKKYEELIDDVVAEYKKKKKITQKAADELAVELKKEWKKVQRELKK